MSTDDVTALKARIAELEKAEPKRRFDGRGLTAWVLLIIAALLFPIALTAFWGQKTLVDTERYISTVAPLADDPTVQAAIGAKVTDVIVTQLDTQARVSALLTDTPRLQPLAGPIAIGVETFVGNQVTKILASDAFDSVWVGINRRLQTSLIKALSGDLSGPVTIEGDQVVLDTGDLIEVVKQKLVDRGLTFAANLPVPAAVDRQIVLLTSPQLQSARTAYALGQPVAEWLIYFVLLMFLIAVLVSRHRARMVMAVGISLFIGALLIRLGMAIGQQQLEVNLSGTTFAIAQNAFFTILTSYLLIAVRAAFALGLVLAIIGWFLSGTSSALATREFLSGAISGAGSKASGTAIAPVGAWFARTRTFWRVAIVVVSAIVILSTSPLTGSTILWTVLIAVIAIVVVELLVAAGGAPEGGDEAADAEPTSPVTETELTSAQVSGGTEESSS